MATITLFKHSLIRAQLMDKFSKMGIVYSITIPILLYFVPVSAVIIDFFLEE